MTPLFASIHQAASTRLKLLYSPFAVSGVCLFYTLVSECNASIFAARSSSLSSSSSSSVRARRLKAYSPLTTSKAGKKTPSTVIDRRKIRRDGSSIDVPISDEHVHELYQHWTDAGLSSLFAARAQKHLPSVASPLVVRAFSRCSNRAESVLVHARCVSRLLDGKIQPAPHDIKNVGARTHTRRCSSQSIVSLTRPSYIGIVILAAVL